MGDALPSPPSLAPTSILYYKHTHTHTQPGAEGITVPFAQNGVTAAGAAAADAATRTFVGRPLAHRSNMYRWGAPQRRRFHSIDASCTAIEYSLSTIPQHARCLTVLSRCEQWMGVGVRILCKKRPSLFWGRNGAPERAPTTCTLKVKL